MYNKLILFMYVEFRRTRSTAKESDKQGTLELAIQRLEVEVFHVLCMQSMPCLVVDRDLYPH